MGNASKETILETARRLPWDFIESQMSFCESVPDSLEELFSPSAETRKNAYFGIDNFVVVQADLYNGAFFTAPFLIEMLKLDSIAKTEILDLLFEIANGSSGMNEVVKYETFLEPFLHYIPSENGAPETLSIACRSAVLKGFFLYANHLKADITYEEKCRALDLVASFVEHRCLVRAALEDALAIETGPFREKLTEALNDAWKW